MTEELAPVPIADGTVRRLFDEPGFRVAKRGYHPDDVVAFLDDLGGRMVALIGRLQTAEEAAKTASGELDGYRRRAEQAESSRQLFDRTLALAEETANASVADAKVRAARIDAEAQQDARRMIDETRLRVERMMDGARVDVQRAYKDERQAIAEAQARIRAEGDQLETLRLAVAAETMALEEVRNELRRRIRRVATDLLGVAESPDGLGAPVTRGIPEVVASQTSPDVGQESSLPRAEPEVVDTTTTSLPPPETAPEVRSDDGSTGREANHLFDQEADGAEAESPTSTPAGDAFDRFMSDEIEEEPSRTWILT